MCVCVCVCRRLVLKAGRVLVRAEPGMARALVHRLLLSHPPTHTDAHTGPAQHLTTVFTIIRWACNLITLRGEDEETQQMDCGVMVRRMKEGF